MATITTTITLRDRISNTLTNIADRTRQATNRLSEMDKQLNQNSKSTDMFSRKLRSLATTYGSLYGLGKLVELSDDMSLSASRLGIALDKMGEKTKSVAEWQNEIYSAAQASRGSYVEMQKSVAKLGMLAGEAFNNSGEISAFVSQLNKMFVLSGAGSREQAMAMYQLTQAMGSGRLQGDEYRSIIENAGYLANAIEDYMRNVEGATGTMKEWAAEGMLTASVIKNAVAYAADDTNKKFKEVGYTWAQVWQGIKNTAVKASMPILKLINLIANNWDLIKPIVIGVASAFAFYVVWTNAAAIATNAMSTAMAVLNAIMSMNPVGIVVIGFIALITIIYAAVAAYNKLKGTSYSATGIIVGCVYVVGEAFRGMWELIKAIGMSIGTFLSVVAENISIAFHNSIASVQAFFYDLLSTATKVISAIAEKLNLLPFVNIDVAELTSAADNYANKADELRNSKKAYKDVIGEANKTLYNNFDGWDFKSAYDKGYNKGTTLRDTVLDKLGISNYGTGSLGISDSIDSIDNNTGDTAKALTKDITDLEWLKKFAEREAINQFTTAEIKVDMSGMQNTVNSELDLDGVVGYLESTLTEKMVSVAEGTHF